MKAMKINLQAQRKTCIESNLNPQNNSAKQKLESLRAVRPAAPERSDRQQRSNRRHKRSNRSGRSDRRQEAVGPALSRTDEQRDRFNRKLMKLLIHSIKLYETLAIASRDYWEPIPINNFDN